MSIGLPEHDAFLMSEGNFQKSFLPSFGNKKVKYIRNAPLSLLSLTKNTIRTESNEFFLQINHEILKSQNT